MSNLYDLRLSSNVVVKHLMRQPAKLDVIVLLLAKEAA